MEHFDPYRKEMEIRQRMEELQRWAANERLARQVRADRPSFVSRIGLIVKRTMISLRRLSGWRPVPNNETKASTIRLTDEALVAGGGHEGC